MRGALVALLAVQVGYLGYAIAKSDSEIFVNRGDGTISALLGYNEYPVYSQGYRLYRVFRDYCANCSVVVSGSEALSAALLREIGRAKIRSGPDRPCPADWTSGMARTGRRFNLVTHETPFGMFKAQDASRQGVHVTIMMVRDVREYNVCRTGTDEFILPATGGRQ